jgi:PPP family 3-phenylpropionic acid transporter
MNEFAMKKSLPFLFYLLYYAAASFTLPFIILYFQGLGFKAYQIGILAGMIPLVTLVGAPFWTRLADAKGRHKLIMRLTILGVIIMVITFSMIKTYGLVLLISVLYAFFLSPVIPLADNATMAMLAHERNLYGRVRLGGTIGWGLMSPVASFIIQSYGIRWAFWGSAMLMVLMLLISQKFTFGNQMQDTAISGDVRQVFTNRRWLPFLSLAFVCGVGLASINSYLFPYMEQLGIPRATMGIALLISTIGELPVLFFTNRLLKRFGAYRLLVLGMMVTSVRLLLYAGLNSTAGILAFQLLNGMTYPMIWVAGVTYADENAPEGMKATAQGLFGAMVLGIGAAMGGLVGGLMLGSIGGQWMYFIFGSGMLLSIALITLPVKIFQQVDRKT